MRGLRARRKKKKKDNISVPVASMGDIAFLLIIFFVVVSEFTKQTSVTIDPAQSKYVDKLEQAKISVSINAEGTLFFQGQEVPDAEAIEWGVRSLVDGAKDDAGRVVLFRCDRSVDRRIFQPVLEAIVNGGGVVAAVGQEPGSGSLKSPVTTR